MTPTGQLGVQSKKPSCSLSSHGQVLRVPTRLIRSAGQGRKASSCVAFDSRSAVGLASYPLMERRSAGLGGSPRVNSTSKAPGGAVGSHSWLALCVRHIVSCVGGSQAGRGPTLQLVFSSNGQHRFQGVPISSSLADDPQNWSQFASHVRDSGANGLVLVRPIASPEQHCVYAASARCSPASPAAASPSPSSSSSSCVGPCQSAQPGPAACMPGATLDGRVGECCDAGSTPDSAPSSSSGSSASAAGLDAGQGSGAACVPGPTQYFGLVVQGSSSSEADGCWVLKTTRSDSGSSSLTGTCSCVHFTLTRVCYGQPLYEQLRDAWLVPQSVAAAAGRVPSMV